VDASRFDRLTRLFAARTSRRTALGTSLAGLVLGLGGSASARQADPNATPQPTEKPVFMFVQTAMSGRGEVNPAAGTPASSGSPVAGGGAPYLLTLEGHSGQTIYFSDRPDRVVGAVPTEEFLAEFGFGPGNPPNAALVGEFAVGQGVMVLELTTPVFDQASGTLTYGAEQLQAYAGDNLEPVTREQVVERLPAEFGPAALFIDDCADIDTCQYGSHWSQFVYVGPVPGGPYGQCWDGVFGGWCQPCWYSQYELNQKCNDWYPKCDGNCTASSAGKNW